MLPDWQDVRNRNYELTDKICGGRPLAFLELLERRAHELCPDYPWNQNDAFEWLWALTSSLEGTVKACEDLHKIINTVTIHQNSNQEYFAERYTVNEQGHEFPVSPVIRGVGKTRGEALVNLLDKEKQNG